MTANLDTRRIRDSTPAQLRDYYKEIGKTSANDLITAGLLGAIEQGLVPPLVFAPWLGISKSPAIIQKALTQNKSIVVRELGIKQLRHSLCSPRWKETWDGIGGTAGILEIFNDFSVLEVKEVCKVIGRCAKGKEVEEKRDYFTALFKGLQPKIFPEAIVKSRDQRPLEKHYGLLLPACSEELIKHRSECGLQESYQDAIGQALLKYHPTTLRKEQIESLGGDQSRGINHEILKGLVRQYPPTPTSDSSFSASMEFALTVLRKLNESRSLELQDEFFVKDLVQPLLKRAIRKRADWVRIQEILDLLMQYLEVHPTAGKAISTRVDDIRHLVALCWSRKPHLFEKYIRKLCAHQIFGTPSLNKISDWDQFLERIPVPKRYTLLRLVFHESVGLDIEDDADLKKVKGALTNDLLNNLGSEQALYLFTRLRAARGDEGLVGFGNADSILNIAASYQGHGADADLYHIALQCQNGNQTEAEKLAMTYVEGRKSRAASASQPEHRGFHGKSVLFAASASGSLSLLQNAFHWTRRFIRDPLTLADIYTRWYPKETIRLLSGIPEPVESSLSLSALRQRVETANSILVGLFETVCEALREPSFSPSNWEGTLSLFYSTVKERIDLSTKLKKVLNASDKDLYCSLWESTIPMLISVEEKANQEGFEKLGAKGLRGILGCVGQSMIELEQKEPSTLNFFDNLAKARDDLWRVLRPKRHPATAALPAVFPRGLAIQHLTTPWALGVQDLKNSAPYLASRVEVTLFPAPDQALEPVHADEELQKAIGLFVDSYQYALQLFIPKSCDKSEVEARIMKVWDYAVGPLSQGRMSMEEAIRFWRNRKPEYLEEWPPKSYISSETEEWPSMPEFDDPTHPLEWNPFTSRSPNVPARELESPTYIDLSLTALSQTSGSVTYLQKISLARPIIPAHEANYGLIWDSSRKFGEAGVLAALIYLDTKFRSTGKRLMESAFPPLNGQEATSDHRYPNLYLDEDFLASEVLDPFTAVRNIRGRLRDIPPVLVQQVASNVINALDISDSTTSTYANLQEVAFILLVRLGESDRPSLAAEIAIRTILEKPNASSWHRQLLKPTFLRRLSAREARHVIETFADRILHSLNAREDASEVAQSENNKSQQGTSSPRLDGHEKRTSGQPFFKVTTMKLLAQLLDSSDFIGEDYAFSTLSSLSRRVLHVDVRLNIVKSLLSKLRIGSPERLENVLTVLEPLISVAGDLNEREPVAERDWAHHEKTLTVPDAQAGFENDLESSSPVLTALIEHYKYAPSNKETLQPFIDRIMLPTLDCLKLQTTRWVVLFLRKHGFDEAAQDALQIPSLPRNSEVTQAILSSDVSRTCYLPSTLLQEFVQYITFNIAPPAPLRALNKKLHEDPSLRSQSEVQTWLHLYGKGMDALKDSTRFSLLSLLEIETKLSENDGVTPRIVQEQFLKLFTAVLWNDNSSYTNLLNHLLHDILSGTHLIESWWQPHGRAVVEAMIAYVKIIRTPNWQGDANRKPPVLPDTFAWQLMLLKYPWPSQNGKDADREQNCKVFAAQLSTIVDEISLPLYHKKLEQLKTYLALDPVSTTKKVGRWGMYYDHHDPLHDALMDIRVLTAIYLGDITKTRLSWITTPELLKVEIAAYLVDIAGELEDVDKALKERLGNLVETWTACENEEVRRIGYVMKEKYFPISRER